MRVPRPGLEPGSARIEGECSSIERAGRRAERESNPRTQFCRLGSSSEIRLDNRAGRGNRTHIGSLEDCGPTDERCPRKMDGQIGETRTRIARVQTGHSPFELRSRGRSGRNRTFSLSFGGSAGHHDSPTYKGGKARRLVGESNPSHPMDSGAATPVASRGEVGVTYGDRTRLRGFTFHPRPRRVTSP